MISTNYQGTPLLLFPYIHDFGAAVVGMECSLPTEITRGITGRETRRPKASLLKVTRLSWDGEIVGAEVPEFRNASRTRGKTRIAVPVWPLCLPPLDYLASPIKGGLHITFEVDGQTQEPLWSEGFAIHTELPATGYTITPDTRMCPLLIGYFEDDAPPELGTDEAQDLQCDFVEDAPADWSIKLNVQVWTNGPDGYPIFPLYPDAQGASLGGARTELETRQLGDARERLVSYWGAPGWRECRLLYPFDGVAELAKLLRFFQDRGGMTFPFWVPAPQAECRLTANAAAGATTLTVDNASLLGTHRELAITVLDHGRDPTVIARRITSIAGNTLTLDSPLPTACNAFETALHSLILCRFGRDRIAIDWDVQGGDCELSFEEVVPELSAPIGETLGVTLGGLPAQVWLYEFSQAAGGVTRYWRYTSWQTNLSYGGNTFAAAKIEHGKIEQGIRLEKVEVEITAEDVENSPISLVAYGQNTTPIRVRILQGQLVNGAYQHVRVALSGELGKGECQGNVVTAKAIAGGRKLDQPFPAATFRRSCWHQLFSTGCGLQASDWQFNGLLVTAAAPGYPHTITVNTLTRANAAPMPTIFADWFAWGWVELGSGATYQSRPILRSTTLSSGALTLTLDGDFAPWPAAGTQLRLFPGCDLQAPTCKAYHETNNPLGKFNNFANWSGCYVSRANLSLVKVISGGGGKK